MPGRPTSYQYGKSSDPEAEKAMKAMSDLMERHGFRYYREMSGDHFARKVGKMYYLITSEHEPEAPVWPDEPVSLGIYTEEGECYSVTSFASAAEVIDLISKLHANQIYPKGE